MPCPDIEREEPETHDQPVRTTAQDRRRWQTRSQTDYGAPRQQLAPRIADPQAGFPIIPEPVLPYVLADLSKYSNLDWYTRILVRKDRSGQIKARKYPFLGN